MKLFSNWTTSMLRQPLKNGRSGVSISRYQPSAISHQPSSHYLTSFKWRSGVAMAVMLVLSGATGWAASEDFANLPTTSVTSYLSRSWTGTDGVTWTALGARTDQTLNGKAICFGTSSTGTRSVTSPTYSGGMGTLTFNYVRGFTGSSGRTLQVYVNGIQVGSDITVSPTSDVSVGYTANVNVTGNVILEIRSTGASQVIVDDIAWNTYAGSPPNAPSLNAATNITSSGFAMNWNAASGATGYQIDISAAGTSNFSSYVSGYDPRDVGNVTTTNVIGLAANTTYYYRVRAYNGSGTSPNSLTNSVTTSASATPKIVIILPGQTQANIGASTAQTAGTAFNITLVATTDGSTTNTSFSGTPNITFSGPTGSPTYPATVTFSSGVGTANITLTKAETTTITATDTSDSIAGNASSSLTVNPGAITSYMVEAASLQTIGIAFDVTVTAKDAYDNTVTTDSFTSVTMGSGSGNVAFDVNPKTLSTGTFTVNATDNTAETTTITANDGSNSGESGPVVVNPIPKYRSKQTGNWNDFNTWQVDTGSGFVDAVSGQTPTYADDTIEIASGDTVTITAAVTVDQVTVDSGGQITMNSAFTIHDGSGDDIDVQNGGVFVLNASSTSPSFNSGATAKIEGGGILRIAVTGITGSTAAIHSANVIYENGSILESTVSSISSSGITYFPNVDANTVPIFRQTVSISPGASSATVFNGVLEIAGGTFSWSGTGTKTFRNGIRGDGDMNQGSAGQFIISGTTAELGGSGTLTLGVNGLQIALGSITTLSSDKTVSSGVVTVAGTLDLNGKTLTLDTAPTFSGTDLTEIDRSGSPTSGKIALSSGTLTYGGALIVTNIGDSLVDGDSFTLFTAGGFGGWFSNVTLPALDPGLTWDTNELATTGVLEVYTFATNAVETMAAYKNTSADLLIAKLLVKVSGSRGAVSLISVSPTSAHGGTLSADANNITYAPATDYVGSDSFTCVLSDGHGSITATVFVTVTDPNADTTSNGSNLAIHTITGGVRIIIAGTSGVNYQLQYTSTMGSPSWTTFGPAFTMPSTGVTNFDDMSVSDVNAHYYRTILP